jgi:hypothetical protein
VEVLEKLVELVARYELAETHDGACHVVFTINSRISRSIYLSVVNTIATTLASIVILYNMTCLAPSILNPNSI